MNNTVWAAIGSAIGGIAAGIISGIFIGKKMQQKRCDDEVDSVREAYRKYFKESIENDAKISSNVPEEKPEPPKKVTGRYPIDNEKSPYQVLTREKAVELANMSDTDIEALEVNESGHHMYISDDILTKKLGMEPKDVAEILKSTGDRIFIKNNIDGKLYEVYIPEAF